MQRSLSHLLGACVFAGTTALGSSLYSAPVSADSVGTSNPGFLRKADRALSRGYPERTLEILSENSGRNLKRQHQADAAGIACRAHLALGSAVDAKTACENAVNLDKGPSSWRFQNNLGAAELALGHFDAAELAFSRASLLARSERAPRRNLKLLADVRQQHDEANGEMVADASR